ncbi:sigma 54-interacting transcriptional regulator [Azoarcus taiwanensis]|uniref:AAA domain-containing protein n=1 Tax=Azoarcus taiwanensis TaxID=666964 RepID=A0A972F5U6_9RHOO|nr:AAA domain-containing protein [Azoarcus taiwanensis]
MADIRFPGNADLRRLIRFSSENGLIWLDESRMVLMHAAALAELRKELVESVGAEQARRILTRMGFASGLRDAELAKKVRAGFSEQDAFVVGPQLHMLEGSVQVEAVKLDMDVASGRFHGEFIWEHSWEAEVHLQEHGQAHHPVCWMQIGYASGYTTGFMGRFILFKEVECAAMGTNHCRIVGRPVEEWPDADDYTPYYEADSIVSQLLELREQVETLRSSLNCPRKVTSLIGASAGFRHAFDLIEKAADTNVTVMLLGETGVGKERFARALHEMSPRNAAPFVAVNCAALPHDLIESELFGVERGAYTGAHASRAGKFERADGGTLFLDEIGELPLPAQAKLLRVVQEGELERLGDERVRKINVRLVAATNVDLMTAVQEGRFRRDLFYRLNVYPVTIPPLRDRIADIPPLVEAMLDRYCTLHGKRIAGVTERAMQALKRHDWPGNVRELENIIERGVILSPNNGAIEAEHLFIGGEVSGRTHESPDSAGLLETEGGRPAEDLCQRILESGIDLESFEGQLLECALQKANGNLSAAARALGMTRPQLDYRLKKSARPKQ